MPTAISITFGVVHFIVLSMGGFEMNFCLSLAKITITSGTEDSRVTESIGKLASTQASTGTALPVPVAPL
jgi:hypothetical protein